MSYYSIIYLFGILPFSLILYGISPKKYRHLVLLFMSYIFFFYISRKLIICLIISTLITYFSGLVISKIETEKKSALDGKEKEEKKLIRNKYNKKKKRILILSLILLVGSLALFKYIPFFEVTLNFIFNKNFSFIHLLAPVGISYYTLEAISYIVDVYNSKFEAEKSLTKVALYLSFFPQLIEGPIARFSDTIRELTKNESLKYQNIILGLERILFGLIKKFVIVDRLGAPVSEIFKNYQLYDGGITLLGAIMFTLMLYADFSGTMDIVIGSAEMFGIKIPENFRQPFFSKSIQEFWRRWHITLGAWLRDYVFYPLSLSKWNQSMGNFLEKYMGKVLARKIPMYISMLIMWLIAGAWHGGLYTIIISSGVLQFTYILLEEILSKPADKIYTKMKIKDTFGLKLFQMIRTGLLFSLAMIFFKSTSVHQGFTMFTNVFTKFSLKGLFNGTVLNLGIDLQDYIILVVFVIVILVVGLIKERGVNLREELNKKSWYIRYPILYIGIASIIVFGAYGLGYDHVDPIYADF